MNHYIYISELVDLFKARVIQQKKKKARVVHQRCRNVQAKSNLIDYQKKKKNSNLIYNIYEFKRHNYIYDLCQF